MTPKSQILLLAIAASALGVADASAAGLEAYGDSSTVYATGVKAAAGVPVLFCSGTPSGRTLGDMKTQALAAMASLERTVTAAGFSLENVVFVRAFVAAGASGTVDYDGWNAAWNTVFNNPKRPWKPARTTVAVPQIGGAGNTIEIEYVCAAGSAEALENGSKALNLPVTNAKLAPYGTRAGRIYNAVGVLPGTSLYWTSGTAAPVADKSAAPASRESRGDMHTQAAGTLKQLSDNLASVGLSFKDVIYLRAYAGPDTFQQGKFDLDGWNKAYSEFFNTPENPHKPARTTVAIPGFGGSTGMLEVEVIAAFPQEPALFAQADAGNGDLRTYATAQSPIASGVAVKAGSPLYFSSGTGPSTGGDMKTQALSALKTLGERLATAGLGFKDVIFLHAYVVPDAGGQFDRAGWTAAYQTCFNFPGQPHKPARSTIEVSGLPKPDWKIELDVIAAAPNR